MLRLHMAAHVVWSLRPSAGAVGSSAAQRWQSRTVQWGPALCNTGRVAQFRGAQHLQHSGSVARFSGLQRCATLAESFLWSAARCATLAESFLWSAALCNAGRIPVQCRGYTAKSRRCCAWTQGQMRACTYMHTHAHTHTCSWTSSADICSFPAKLLPAISAGSDRNAPYEMMSPGLLLLLLLPLLPPLLQLLPAGPVSTRCTGERPSPVSGLGDGGRRRGGTGLVLLRWRESV